MLYTSWKVLVLCWSFFVSITKSIQTFKNFYSCTPFLICYFTLVSIAHSVYFSLHSCQRCAADTNFTTHFKLYKNCVIFKEVTRGLVYTNALSLSLDPIAYLVCFQCSHASKTVFKRVQSLQVYTHTRYNGQRGKHRPMLY